MIRQHALQHFDELEVQPQPTKIIISALAAMTKLPVDISVPPILLKGTPGVGKSQFMLSLAQQLNIPCVAASAVMFTADWIAIPVRGEKISLDESTTATVIEYAYPKFLFQFIQEMSGIFVIDELDKLPRELMSSMLGILSERRIGYLTFPPRVLLIAAMNPLSAGGYQIIDPALANRFIHLTFIPDVNEVIRHLDNLSNPLDKRFYKLHASIDIDIFEYNFKQLARIFAQFLRNFPNTFETPADDWNEDCYAYTTPRSFVDLALPALTALLSARFTLDNFEFIVPISSPMVLSLLESTIGTKNATLLFKFLTNPPEEVDIFTILDQPESFPYSDFDKRLFVIDKISQHFNNNPDLSTLDKITRLLQHFLDSYNDASLASLLLSKIRKAVRKLAKTCAQHEAFQKFVKFVAEHQTVFYSGSDDA